MKTLLKITLTVMSLYLAACAPGGDGGTTTPELRVAPDVPADLVPEPVDPSAPVDATVSLSYYKLSKTVAPVNGWSTKTYTATGYCVQYQAQTYCWDDGLKTLQWTSGGSSYGPFKYTYFGMGGDSSNWGPCSGGCVSDLMPLPRIISFALQNNLAANAVNNVFTQGIAVPVTCTESGGQLNCVDFVINLNQAPL